MLYGIIFDYITRGVSVALRLDTDGDVSRPRPSVAAASPRKTASAVIARS